MRDQGSRPTCLAFAMSAAHEHARHHIEPLSPEALFRGFERRADDAAKWGTTLSTGLTTVGEDGQCDEVAWPYGDADASDPDAVFYRARYDARVATDLGRFSRDTLASGRLVLLALRLTDAWHRVGSNGIIEGPLASDQWLGFHAVLAVGYNAAQETILIRNSWGTNWGSGGHAWIGSAYLELYGLEAVTLVALSATHVAPTP